MGGATTGGSKVADASLNVVPTIDLLICLICFLVVSAAWTSLTRIDVDQALPRRTTDAKAPPKARPQVYLAVSQQGFEVNLAGGDAALQAPAKVDVLGDELRLCRGKRGANGACMGATDVLKKYDHDGLAEAVGRLAKASPDGYGTRVMVAMEDDVPYAHLIGAMDTVLGVCGEGDGGEQACLTEIAVGDIHLLRAKRQAPAK